MMSTFADFYCLPFLGSVIMEKKFFPTDFDLGCPRSYFTYRQVLIGNSNSTILTEVIQRMRGKVCFTSDDVMNFNCPAAYKFL